MKKEEWVSSTKMIFIGVLLYYLCGVIGGIFDGFGLWLSLALGSGIGAIKTICSIAVVVGVILYLVGLSKFKKAVDNADVKSVSKIFTACILMVIAAVLDFIPGVGWIGTILVIIGYIMSLLGFSALKKSTTFPEKARKGASFMFIAAILVIIGKVLGFIPMAGGIIEVVFLLVATILFILGWYKVKSAVV